MKCSVCKSDLEEKEIIENLYVSHCKTCEGNYLKFDDYLAWKTLNKRKKVENEKIFENIEVNDEQKAKLCSCCNRIMTRYRVSSELNFYIDYCSSCGGVLFDKGELEEIINKKLHHNITNFFTVKWQKGIRGEEVKKHMESLYLKRFGEEDYNKIKEIRDFIYKQENSKKSYLISFLTDENPYKI